MDSSDLPAVELSAYEPAEPANVSMWSPPDRRTSSIWRTSCFKYHRMFCFLYKSRLKPLFWQWEWSFWVKHTVHWEVLVVLDLSWLLMLHTEGRRQTTGGVVLDFTQAVEHIYHPLMKSSHTELVVIPTATNETWRARNERPTMTTWV